MAEEVEHMPRLLRIAAWQDGSALLLPRDESDERCWAGRLLEWAEGHCLVHVNGRVVLLHCDGQWVDVTAQYVQ